MARHFANIMIVRDDEEIEIEVAADFEYFRSANSRENGYGMGQMWCMTQGIKLTDEERIRAEEALYENL